MDTIVSIFTSSLTALNLSFGGWPAAITIFATLLRITLFPIQIFNFKQQRLMQKIQPELDILQDKYKDAPAKLFAETNAMKAREGVKTFWMMVANVIQIPIFLSAYRSLSLIPNLSGEGFLWISSLGAPDPLLVLPVLVAASGFLQQKLSRSQSAASNRQLTSIVKFLPILSMVFMAVMPASLNLYYAVSGIVQIAGDSVIRKFLSI